MGGGLLTCVDEGGTRGTESKNVESFERIIHVICRETFASLLSLDTQVEANGMKTRSKQRTKPNIRSVKSEHAVNKHKNRSERLVRKVPCRSERARSIWSRGPERDARNVFYACFTACSPFTERMFVFVRCFERVFMPFASTWVV